jgi:hypothetical protein
MSELIGSVFTIFIIMVLFVILGPIATIWSLNTLFPLLHIPYTLDTWCAVVILGGVFKTSFVKKG